MALLASCTRAPVPLAPQRAPVPVIFATDLGYDADDASALAVLHALADNGEAEILATMTVVGDPYSAGALSAIDTHYGRPELPIGTMKGGRWSRARLCWFEDNRDFLCPLVREFNGPIRHRARLMGRCRSTAKRSLLSPTTA